MDKLRRLLILLLALMLMAPISGVSADSDDDDDDDDDDEDKEKKKDLDDSKEKHTLNVNSLDDSGIKVTLKRKAVDNESKIEFKMDLDKTKFRLKYEEETGLVEVEQKLSVELRHLVEYRDTDGNGAFTEGEEILSSWGFGHSHSLLAVPVNGTMNWATPTLEDITMGGVLGKKISATATMGENTTSIFKVDIMVFGELTSDGLISLAPTDVKIDFIIENYAYTANDTALALMLRTKTKQEIERDHADIDSDEEGVVANSNTNGGTPVGLAFTWKGNATVDGVDTTVGTTVFASTTEDGDNEFAHKQDFALSYVRGTVIVHDPTAGVNYDVALENEMESEEDSGMFNLPDLTTTTVVVLLLAAAVTSDILRRKAKRS